MPLVPTITRNAVNGSGETNAPTAAPGPEPILLDGCEPMVSAIGQSPLAHWWEGKAAEAVSRASRPAAHYIIPTRRITRASIVNLEPIRWQKEPIMLTQIFGSWCLAEIIS